ncbi:MAG: hypothetical protein WAV98_02110 [Minisyncoccia bacterium]
MKRFLLSIVLVVFIGGGALSFFAMGHSNDGVMNGNCPITALAVSVCPSEALSAISHYISMYQVFTTGIVSSIMTEVLMPALLFVAISYWLQKYITPVLNLFILFRIFRAKLYKPKTFTRWLSLLVNSPSFI